MNKEQEWSNYSLQSKANLQKHLEELTKTYPGTYAFYVGNIMEWGLDDIAQHNISEVFPAASMIKILIMETLFAMARQGELNILDKVNLKMAPRVEGGGALQELNGVHEFSYLELASLMMILSDNWATNILIRALSMNAINDRAVELGLRHTRLNRIMMDFKAQAAGFENEICVADLKTLLQHLFDLQDEAGLGREMWRILGRQQFRDKIPFYWPDDAVFYHKTGELSGIEHDAGIYMCMEGNFVLIILVKDLAHSVYGRLVIADMGKSIYSWILEEAL